MEMPTNIYYFRDGQMLSYVPTSPDGFEVFPRGEKESDKDYFCRLGFEYRYSVEMLTWCRRSFGQGPEYLARWYDNGELAFIFVHSWPDLLKLRILLAPVLQTHYLHNLETVESAKWHAEQQKRRK